MRRLKSLHLPRPFVATFHLHINSFVRIDNSTKGVLLIVIKPCFLFRPIVIVTHEILPHLPKWVGVYTRTDDNDP